MARKNKNHGEPENGERWLLTYADMITLLLIFFIILYSMSKIDAAKYTVLANSLAKQFKKVESVIPKGTTGQADPGNAKVDQKHVKGGADSTDTQKDPNQTTTAAAAVAEAQIKDQQLKNLLQKIKQYIADNNLQLQVSAEKTDRGVVITLNDLFLFDSGKADLKPVSYPILQRLASLFPTLKTKISIEGHTDNQPLNSGSIYKDNEGLSAARSLSVIRYFDQIPGLADMLQGTFYGDTHPIAPNDNAVDMQKNRRVEIIVLRDIPTDVLAAVTTP